MTNRPEINVLHDHDGGECPVPDDTIVTVWYNGGGTITGPARVRSWRGIASYLVHSYPPGPERMVQDLWSVKTNKYFSIHWIKRPGGEWEIESAEVVE